MDKRLVANSVCGSSAALAVLALIAKRMGFPAVSDALAFFKVSGVDINWNGVWIIILVASIVTAIFVNLQKMTNAIARWRGQRHRDWNMNFCDAIAYLVSESLDGQAWPSASRVQFATGALYEAAKKGQVTLSGLPEGSVLRVKIPKRWFNGKTIIDIKNCTAQYKAAFLLEDKRLLFGMLFTDKKQVHKIWPPRPRSPYRI